MEPKVRYFYPEAVDDDPQAHETFRVYHCDYCGMYHIGHKRRTGRYADSDTDTATYVPVQRHATS